MEKYSQFADFDDGKTYNDSQKRALIETTLNFVVEFGKDKAQIAFDLEADDIQTLLDSERTTDRPVRWINIWAPHRQTDVVNLLGNRYKFSPRLLAILRTKPPETNSPSKPVAGFRAKLYQKDDLEVATTSVDLPRSKPTARFSHQDASHYKIADQMVNYQSVDSGSQFFCIGANWMHELSTISSDESIISEGKQRRLWSWLILCDNHTVISIHEYPGRVNNENDLRSMRANTISVLSQLSKFGHDSADPISMQTVRQALELDVTKEDPGIEGASNLFYYLFDDWRAVYSTVADYNHRLNNLQGIILGDVARKSSKILNAGVIPQLHVLGGRIRRMKHLYEGYHKLTQRILEQKPSINHGGTTPHSSSGLGVPQKGVVIAQSAMQRFERLGDRLQLLILSELAEFLTEKDALISTYFNINAQKDSEATARLTRSATLLAKLSVLFLPVSLMTSYFSTQISELQGVYTSKDYWYSFAVLMSISFLALFFFSRMLMWVTETLDLLLKRISKAFTRKLVKKLRARDASKNENEDEDEGYA